MNVPTPAKKLSIVLIDDEPSVSYALRLLLSAVGYTVHDFGCGLEALEQLRGGLECDFVLTDLRMPVMDGFAVIESVKGDFPALPVVLMSAHASKEEQEKATSLGASAFLGKPFSPDQVHELVESLQLHTDMAAN